MLLAGLLVCRIAIRLAIRSSDHLAVPGLLSGFGPGYIIGLTLMLGACAYGYGLECVISWRAFTTRGFNSPLLFFLLPVLIPSLAAARTAAVAMRSVRPSSRPLRRSVIAATSIAAGVAAIAVGVGVAWVFAWLL